MTMNSFIQVLLLASVLCANLALGSHVCEDSSGSIFLKVVICSDDQYCCGLYNNQCCSSSNMNGNVAAEFFSAVIAFGIVFVCCVCCYRCCCRRTASSGTVYTPASCTTGVSVCLPPQQGGGYPTATPYPLSPQQGGGYPTAGPYPQQTSYPMPTPYQPQPATNPYLNMPPPPYHSVVQEGFQQALPTAPHFPN